MADLTPQQRILAAALDVLVVPSERRVRQALGGNPDSATVGIYWGRFVKLHEAVEAAHPGLIQAVRDKHTEIAAEQESSK